MIESRRGSLWILGCSPVLLVAMLAWALAVMNTMLSARSHVIDCHCEHAPSSAISYSGDSQVGMAFQG